MEETWYILVTRHFEGNREEKKLYMTEVCAKEFDSKKEVQEFIARWLSPPKNYQLAPSECAMPTYEPVTAAMFDSI
ncbi:MAG: hypothetical protein LBC63_06010 [Holophagales bacterium]|jgi:hypothetical protein|nr:hypothetical protein [Holophagales bacterium]